MNKYRCFPWTTTFSLITMLLISFAGCSKSYATREMNNTFETSARQSETIVLAKCTDNEVVGSENGMIFTVTTFNVEKVIKGEVGEDKIQIRLPGGQKGDTKINVPDRPEFVEMEDVILFLEKKGKNGYYIVQSLTEGVYRVYYDESRDSRYVISSDAGGMTIYNSSTGKELSDRSKVELENFIYSIERIVRN